MRQSSILSSGRPKTACWSKSPTSTSTRFRNRYNQRICVVKKCNVLRKRIHQKFTSLKMCVRHFKLNINKNWQHSFGNLNSIKISKIEHLDSQLVTVRVILLMRHYILVLHFPHDDQHFTHFLHIFAVVNEAVKD